MRATLKIFLFAQVILTPLFFMGLISCETKIETDGPFFGNGLHNGWADQSSIVIWTRLTEIPEGNSDGTDFLVPTSAERRRLENEGTRDEIMQAQIPEGLTLDRMIGACPGAPGEVKLTYYPRTDKKKSIETAWVVVDDDKNFTKQWKLENLLPGTHYVVNIQARQDKKSKVSDEIAGAFRTAPARDDQEEIAFTVVTCQEYWRTDTTGGHKIYDEMLKLTPDFYVHTGDIEYYDRLRPYALNEELMRFKWDRIFALPLQREFWGQVTSYFMKDDHDVLTDDAYPGMTYGTVSWERGLEIFDEQNPASALPYKTIRWGKDLQIWVTEGRAYRSKNSDPDGPEKTIFGQEQKEWLFRTLEESDATFKVIINANPILGPDRDRKNDNYANAGFKHEGDEIRQFLNQFDNLYLVTGDRHWQYVTHFKGTNLWEFGTGSSSDSHAGGWEQDDLRPEHRFLRVKGGFLFGKVTNTNNTQRLIFQHYDVDGNVVHEEAFGRRL